MKNSFNHPKRKVSLKTKICWSVAMLILMPFIFESCKKSGSIGPNNFAAKPILTVQDGVITFATMDDFNYTMTYYQAQPIEKLQDDINKLAGFSALSNQKPTLQTAGNPLAREEDDSTPPEEPIVAEDSLVQDPYVQSIMNNKREISIEGYMVRVTEKGVFAYLPTQRINFEAAYLTIQFDNNLAGKFTDDDINVQQDLQEIVPNVFLVFRQPLGGPETAVANRPGGCNGPALGSNLFGQISDCNSRIDGRRRIRYTTYAQNLGFYSSIGFKTRRQTRFLGVWWAANAQVLSCEGEGGYESKWPTGTLFDYPYTRSGSRVSLPGVSSASRVLSWNTGKIGIKLSGGSPKVTFKFAQKYKYKVHTSDHAARNNNINYSARMIHN